ncbi:hypothetical protein Tdes44962_MAKER03245 [Teratosphaeria destructans]|uniref:Uncharacterized protein n=1 Tax=Teratosphaeria destructans TaxID=418781 RepID=A0A9W7SQP1_9PEZI|nr:hypothetical protein Tdes44962_MAKER03245 [Teratosphaeria destructans]
MSQHGRKPGITGDGLERGRNGAYYPTGITNRRNVEATSPWAPKSDNACPDCVAEMGYKRREQLQAAIRPEKSREPSPAYSAATTAQTRDFGSPLIHVPEIIPSEVVAPAPKPSRWLPGWLHGSEHASPFRHDDSTIIQHLNALSPKSTSNEDLITTEDLGDGLDAAIFERHGRLERVVLNRRLGETSTAETLLRLSKNLFAVAQALQNQLEPPSSQKLPVIEVEKPVAFRSNSGSDIRKAPNPYHHAPSEPRSLHYAQWHAAKKSDNQAHVQIASAVHIPTITVENHHPSSPRLIATPDLTPSLRSTPAHGANSDVPLSTPSIPLQHFATNLTSPLQFGPLQNVSTDIRKHPNPYHHAPPEPRSLAFAQWADKGVQAMQQKLKEAAEMEEQKMQEVQQMVKDGFRVERRATLKQAAEWEKQFRRQQASGSAKAGKGIWGIFT